MSPTQLDDTGFHIDRHLMSTTIRLRAAINECGKTTVGVFDEPHMHRLTSHPIPPGDVHHRRPLEHLPHRCQPLFHETQLHQHDRLTSLDVDVNDHIETDGDQPRADPKSQAGAGTTVSQQAEPLSPTSRDRIPELSRRSRSHDVHHEPGSYNGRPTAVGCQGGCHRAKH